MPHAKFLQLSRDCKVHDVEYISTLIGRTATCFILLLVGMSRINELVFLATQKFTEKSMDFQVKIIERSGLGDETYLPQGRRVPQHFVATYPHFPSLLRYMARLQLV